MKVILLKNVPDLGQTGEIKQVSDGFARNYLLPKNLVKIATDLSAKEMGLKKKFQIKALENRSKKFKEIAKKINNTKIILKAKASASASADTKVLADKEASADKDDKNTLYAAITAVKIAEELKNRKYIIDPKYIKLEQPIKQLGYYDILIDFGAGVTAKVGLTVTRE